MGKLKTNIIIFGFGHSGSSAVQWMLTEYINVAKFFYMDGDLITGEMNHFRLPGMIGDMIIDSKNQSIFTNYLKTCKPPEIPLSLRLRTLIPDIIYKLYKDNEFSKSLAKRRIQTIKTNKAYFSSLNEINVSLLNCNSTEKKIEIARNWLQQVNCIYGKNKDFIVHKPFAHEAHLNIWPKVFDPFKVICVFREPIDHVSTLLAKAIPELELPWQLQLLFGLDKNSRTLFHTLIDTTIYRMNKMNEIEREIGSDCFLKLDFEGLVKNYDIYKKIIENFIGLRPEDHLNARTYFNPEISIHNINKYSSLLNDDDLEKISPMFDWYQESMNSVQRNVESSVLDNKFSKTESILFNSLKST